VRSISCVSSKDPPRGRRRGHRWKRRRRRRATKGATPRKVESPAPVTTGRRGGCGVGACSGRGGTRHWVISGGARERHGGVSGRNSGALQTLKEEEVGLLQLEVSSTSPVHP
jgi:hypothetical protein